MNIDHGVINPDQPVLPYGHDDPSSGYAAGVATSEERARREDNDGTTARRQSQTLGYLAAAGARGVTWQELSQAYLWHHGQSSSVLSGLHKTERIARLAERRNRCHVYVLPEHVDGRDTQAQGRGQSTRDRLAAVEGALAAVHRLHPRIPARTAGHFGCGHCHVPYPCPTVRAATIPERQ